jgi:hypothetical protein
MNDSVIKIKFTSNSTSYSSIQVEPDPAEGLIHWVMFDETDVYNSQGWIDEAYRTINIEPQILTKDDYDDLSRLASLTHVTTNLPEIKIAVNDSTTFTGSSQVLLSGGAGEYTVSDEAISGKIVKENAICTTSLEGNVYNIDWDIDASKDGTGADYGAMINGKYTILFSDGESSLDFDITIDGIVCLTGDMLITLADGSQKRIDEISLNDKVLAINPDTGELCEDIISFTDSNCVKKHYHYHKFTFEDGTVIKTVHRHRFYNIEEQQMSHLDLFYTGDHVVKQDGTTTRLVSGELIEEEVRHYTIFTRYQNYFVNGILSGNRFTPYMALGEIPEQEEELANQGSPVFNGAGGDIILLYGSK